MIIVMNSRDVEDVSRVTAGKASVLTLDCLPEFFEKSEIFTLIQFDDQYLPTEWTYTLCNLISREGTRKYTTAKTTGNYLYILQRDAVFIRTKYYYFCTRSLLIMTFVAR